MKLVKLAIAVAVTLLVAGCVTAPKPLQGEFSHLSPEQARNAGMTGESVRWGGSIVRVEPAAGSTCIEVLGRELGNTSRPLLKPDESAGRFLACRAGFYDPAIFAEQREVTITGRIEGYEPRRIGEYEYLYPRVAADVIYLWPERREVDMYPVSPFWSIYRPHYGWGGYYAPIRVRASTAPAKPASSDK